MSRKSLILLNVVLGEAALVLFLLLAYYAQLDPRLQAFGVNLGMGVPIVAAAGLSIASLVLAGELLRLARSEERLREAEKLAAVAELAAGVAHEVRNLVTSVSGFIQFISQRLRGDDLPGKAELERYLGVMKRDVDQVEELVSQFLMLARPPAVSFQLADLNALVMSVTESLAPTAEELSVSLSAELGSPLPNVEVDEKGMRQALVNLVLNALQHTPGGGRVEVRTCYLPFKRQIHVVISDTGTGIAPENLGRIFDPFFTTRDDGVGLGLAISKRIAHDHRGDISVRSRPGKGSEFVMILPVGSAGMPL